jgi:rubredoxin-NAD+ reductase
MQAITIIGTGMAGYSVAREFRKHDPDSPLRLLTADQGESYAKPMLSNALVRKQEPLDLAMKDAAGMAGQLGAEILTEAPVTALDIERRVVRVGDAELAWSSLVMALGADPISLPLQGNGSGQLLSVNDLQDYRCFRERLEGRQRVAMLGAGLIGCEFANDLAQSGYRVDVIDLAPLPLGRLVPPEIGQAMQQSLAALGVDWHLGTSVRAVETKGGSGLTVVLDNGETLSTDLMLSAVGLRPRTALADAAGLAVGRGIAVDRFLRSNAEGVYAIGDCAEVGGLLLPFVMPIMQGARALGQTLAGTPTAVSYPAMPVTVKTPALPVVVCPPLPGIAGQWQTTMNDDAIRSLFVDDQGGLQGFALSGAAVVEKAGLAGRLAAWL